jgi:hypothetical protein
MDTIRATVLNTAPVVLAAVVPARTTPELLAVAGGITVVAAVATMRIVVGELVVVEAPTTLVQTRRHSPESTAAMAM